jgi:hypothetical protein
MGFLYLCFTFQKRSEIPVEDFGISGRSSSRRADKIAKFIAKIKSQSHAKFREHHEMASQEMFAAVGQEMDSV